MSNKIPCGGFYLDDMLNVNDSGELSIKGGTSYQQLVTDGSGNTKWEDRLAYTNRIAGSDGPIITFQAYLNTISPLTLSEPLIVGAPYTVNVGNDKYKTTCATDGDHLYITVPAQGTLQGTLVVDDPINNPLVALWNGAATYKRIEIVRESQEEVKQIDQKYIPPTTVIVNITNNEDGTYSADKTFNEVKSLIDSGVDVKCSYNRIIANYAGFNEEMSVMSFEVTTFGIGDGITMDIYFAPDGIFVEGFSFGGLLLPEVSASDNNEFLSVVNGTWKASSNLILPSSTSGSTKKFKITVDDSGTISATQVT